MRLVSFNTYRTLTLPGVTYVKPEHLFRQTDLVRAADAILFPASW